MATSNSKVKDTLEVLAGGIPDTKYTDKVKNLQKMNSVVVPYYNESIRNYRAFVFNNGRTVSIAPVNQEYDSYQDLFRWLKWLSVRVFPSRLPNGDPCWEVYI